MAHLIPGGGGGVAVVLEMPTWVGMMQDLGTQRSTSRRINARSSKVIMLQSRERSVFERHQRLDFKG